MPIVTQCPSCGKRLKAPEDRVGRQATCPQCKADFTIAAVDGGAPVSTAPSNTGAPDGEVPMPVLKSAAAEPRVASTPAPVPVSPVTSPAPKVSAPAPSVPNPATPVASTSAASTSNAKQSGRDEWHVQTSEGTRYGPVTRAELDVWLAEDRLDAECQLLKEGWDQWKWAEEVFPQLKSAGAAASSEKDEDPFPVIADEGVAAKRGAPRLKAAGAPAIGVRADNPFAATDSGDPAQRVKHRRPISSIPVPDYVWLKFLGGVFTVIGLIVIGLAALATVIMLILAAVGSAQSSRAGDAIGGFVGMMFFNVMMFGMAFLTGAFYLAIGQALYAFRDMAQNSWKAVALLDKD